MKLKIDEFENYAKRNGISASLLFKKLGGGKNAYRRLKSGCSLGYELAKDMFNTLGEWTFLSLVDLEGETIDGFKAKYILVGNKLV